MTATASPEPAENLLDGAAPVAGRRTGQQYYHEEKGEISLHFTNKLPEAKHCFPYQKVPGTPEDNRIRRFILLSQKFSSSRQKLVSRF